MNAYQINDTHYGVEIQTPDGLRLPCTNRALAETCVAFWTGHSANASVMVPREAETEEPALPPVVIATYERRYMQPSIKERSLQHVAG
ncbi:hypothetical protein [Cerasicoccus arenae]|uniref:Uncharacterized protein n=1 Tax=Cerasicoccus arenae TaxID=424488 RepID=A0A8J3DAE7_9BACT|nr:hypothetical protein [Cerasicoccus arenae]MBK1858217.1 hypothetical protein [Cerasicoccus arenae]GHC01962.1 hypothetical protein GCM10007047_18040 [Cerasicoccus arenae]